ncbi:MAG: HDIG domain-containing protein [Flavobacteriia bacterium]|nr:HDIG domain-containing protein [Flavobacteriia bacterium]
MKSIWKFILAQQAIIYKSILILLSSVFLLYLFPRGGQFKYEFQKGRIWQFPDYYAPFDFSILKSKAEFEADQQKALQDLSPYLRSDQTIKNAVFDKFPTSFDTYFSEVLNTPKYDSLYQFGTALLEEIYQYGVLPPNSISNEKTSINLIKGTLEIPLSLEAVFRSDTLFEFLSEQISSTSFLDYEESYKDLFFELITPNLFPDTVFDENAQKEVLRNISQSRGIVSSGSLIIKKGDLLNDEVFEILDSLRNEFSLRQGDQSNSAIVFGYSILILLSFTLLLLFLHKYRYSIYENNLKLTFIFFNILFVFLLVTAVLQFDTAYLFAVPICILPLIIKAFFDARLGLFAHVLTVLLIGFIVPNSFEYVFIQILAGIVTIQSVSQLYRRANLFISVGQIILVYGIGYLAFTTIQEGSIFKIDYTPMALFLLNGLLMLFVQPLIYIYEKLFGLVSDISLLELSDTNTVLLKKLSEKAPGTFHHSLQVANLAESAANEIGANALLVRVGALYHDIGKLENPYYFSENQSGLVSPHDELTPKQSAQLIINHVREGIKLGQKYKLPDRIIDFIRTHHGTSSVYYFYKMQLELDPEAAIEDFLYPGPRPFSKETAILMMADAVEAASKSLKSPNIEELEAFINTIIEGKMKELQFNESTITLSEIETVKKVLFNKLINVYQLRIEYPK